MAKRSERRGRKKARQGKSGDAPGTRRGRETGGRGSGPPATGLPFRPLNAVVGGAALVVVVAGYVLLGQGSITAAPILLVLGYVILFPIALAK